MTNDATPPLSYHHGFGNSFDSSAHPSSLPIGRNNPRIVPCGLYTEQLSGTAFTAPRCENRRTWLYRVVPGVVGTSCQGGFHSCGSDNVENSSLKGATSSLPVTFGKADWTRDMKLDPNPMRWGATPLETSSNNTNDTTVNFLQGIHTLLGSGDPTSKAGIGIYVYAFNTNMTSNTNDDTTTSTTDQHMYNSDGDFLIVPQQLGLAIQTELGKMTVIPGEICVVPRGIVFSINILKGEGRTEGEEEGADFARGYILEIFRGHFQLPELGPIGSNGLANARDFLHPKAYYEDPATSPSANAACIIVNKFGQQMFARVSPHSPYNVVSWHGNYLPFKYDLRRFCAVNSVTYDHIDPSIYTVLTAKGGDEEGTALADFVIFPPRIMATDENTFRPPWFHRNVMTEFMGLISGEYDAKKRSGSGGFVPGGASLHSIMTPHGPDAESYYANAKNPCDAPTKFEGGLAFMFESSAMCKVSRYALECDHRERDYAECWDGLKATFPDLHV
jgi:homogentisate 1,2-dioxygenase